MFALTYIVSKNVSVNTKTYLIDNIKKEIMYPHEIVKEDRREVQKNDSCNKHNYIIHNDNIKIIIKCVTDKCVNFIGENIEYILFSDTVDIKQYLEMCEQKYDINFSVNHQSKIFCFKYNDAKKFTTYILKDNDKLIGETFDNVFSEHNDVLINDIARLKDDKYYLRTGMRRKKSYLFYGEPGCGKNATVMATALYDARHIIDIPAGIIKTNSEFEEILNLSIINSIPFKKNEIIIMFDELDLGFNNDNDIDNNNDNNKNKNDIKNQINKLTNVVTNGLEMISDKTDKLNIGNVLSLLDGICNYSGLIIVAMTNNKENLPKALCRDLRLTPIYFTYLRQIDVINLLEKFFELKLEDSQKSKIPDRKLSPAKCRLLCEKYEKLNINDFINILNNQSKYK